MTWRKLKVACFFLGHVVYRVVQKKVSYVVIAISLSTTNQFSKFLAHEPGFREWEFPGITEFSAGISGISKIYKFCKFLFGIVKGRYHENYFCSFFSNRKSPVTS